MSARGARVTKVKTGIGTTAVARIDTVDVSIVLEEIHLNAVLY